MRLLDGVDGWVALMAHFDDTTLCEQRLSSVDTVQWIMLRRIGLTAQRVAKVINSMRSSGDLILSVVIDKASSGLPKVLPPLVIISLASKMICMFVETSSRSSSLHYCT